MKAMMKQPPVVLSIAGSDPSGGAGIQADLKSISALGGYGAAVITAITAQNTLGVQGVFPLAAEVVRAQLDSVCSDLQLGAVKIGMVHDAGLVEVIVECLKQYQPPFIVYDPVMISTSGRRLMTEESIAAIEQQLFPYCSLITPNLDEASLLVGHRLETPEEMAEAGGVLARRYGCNVLVKGGHLCGERMCDVLCDGEASQLFEATKSRSNNLHGTGCTLSSAIATYLAQGEALPDAIAQAKKYITQAIEAGAALHIGQGNGPLWHFF